MTRFTRTLLIAGFALGTTLAGVAELQAGCGGGGGGGYHRRYSSYSRPMTEFRRGMDDLLEELFGDGTELVEGIVPKAYVAETKNEY